MKIGFAIEVLENQKKEPEKVPVVVRKLKQKLAQELPTQEQGPDERLEVPRRWCANSRSIRLQCSRYYVGHKAFCVRDIMLVKE